MVSRWWALTWPRAVEVADLHNGLRQMVGSRLAPIVLRSESKPGLVRHLVGADTAQVGALVGRLVPGIGVEEVSPLSNDELTHVVSVRFSTRQRAVTTLDHERAVAALVTALAQVHGKERLILEWVLTTPLSPQAVPSKVEGMGPERWSRALVAAPFGTPPPLDNERRRALRDKRSEPGWRVLGRIGIRASSVRRGHELLAGVLTALRGVESPGLRLVVRSSHRARFGRTGVLGHAPAALNVAEVALLAGWPAGSTVDLPVRRVVSRRLVAHPAMPPVDTVSPQRRVARSNYPGSDRALVLPEHEALRHVHVLGPTGVGKSTMLLGLIRADMAAGRSVVVIDPKGDLVVDVAARVPLERRDDVVVLDPTADQVVGLNALAKPADPDLVADELLGVLHALFESSWGPRTHDIVHAGLLTLARAGGQSLVGLPLLLTNQGFRRRLTAGIDDPLGLGGFWAWYESISEAERATAMGPVLNKLRTVLLRPGLRDMLGQTSPRFDIADVFQHRRIVLVNLSKGRLGPEGASLFGALVMHQLWQAALARTKVPADKRHPVMAYLDEFQEYLRLPLNLTDMLVQARSLGFGLHLAHQHLGQLSPAVREAVLGNAGSRVLFRLGAGDAATLGTKGSNVEPADLIGLGAYEVLADLLVGASPSGFMSGRTEPPPMVTGNPESVLRASTQAWGVPRGQVEAELRALIEPSPPPAAEGGGFGTRKRPGTGAS